MLGGDYLIPGQDKPYTVVIWRSLMDQIDGGRNYFDYLHQFGVTRGIDPDVYERIHGYAPDIASIFVIPGGGSYTEQVGYASEMKVRNGTLDTIDGHSFRNAGNRYLRLYREEMRKNTAPGSRTLYSR